MNELPLIVGAGLLVGAAVWWWWNDRQGAALPGLDGESNEGESLMQKIETAASTAAGALWMPPASAAPYLAAIAAAESKYGLPHNMLARLLYQESRFRQDIITGKTKSSAGALGIAQFMPATAAEMGINPLDPFQAIDAAGKYLAKLYKKFGDWGEALAAYNWGQGNVAKKGLAAAPKETKNYFSQILSDLGLA